MRKILITNDDGINASGIERLARVAKQYGEVWVVAPDSQRSATSHSIDLRNEILVKEVSSFPVEGVHAFETSGSPADCVRIGSLNIVPGGPDMIFSGINFGYNAGTDVMYSGTVGAAMEGMFQGIPSVAFSEGTNDGYVITDLHLEAVLAELMERLSEEKNCYIEAMKYDSILNVNFPTCKPEELKGVLWDRTCSKGHVFKDTYVCRDVDDGIKAYKVNGQYEEVAEDGSDLRALFDNYISVGLIRNIG